MNYQQAIADAIRQITFQNVDAAITAAEAGFGFLSCFPAAAATEAAWASSTTAAADAAVGVRAATTAAEAGSGFSFFCAAAVAAMVDAAADASLNISGFIHEGSCNANPLNCCNTNNGSYFIIYMIKNTLQQGG